MSGFDTNWSGRYPPMAFDPKWYGKKPTPKMPIEWQLYGKRNALRFALEKKEKSQSLLFAQAVVNAVFLAPICRLRPLLQCAKLQGMDGFQTRIKTG